jgi:uncharacterized membrane protein
MKKSNSIQTSVYVDMNNVCSIAQENATKHIYVEKDIKENKANTEKLGTKVNAILLISVTMFAVLVPEQIWRFIGYVL